MFLDIGNPAAVNTDVQVLLSFCHPEFFSFGYRPHSSMFSFSGTLHTVSPDDCLIYIATNSVGQFPFLCILAGACVLFCFVLSS